MSPDRGERIALFIDGSNLQAATKSLQLDIDYRRLLMLFKQRGYLARAHYYAATGPQKSDSTLKPLLDWLSYNGFLVSTRDTIIQHAIAVDIAVDAMQMADNIDHFVFFTGSIQFVRLIEALQHRGRKVSVVSTVRSGPAAVADELRRQADHFLELEELRPILERGAPTPRSDSTDDSPNDGPKGGPWPRIVLNGR